MSRCNYCGLEIIDQTEHCPLCHGVLEHGTEGTTTYPDAVTSGRKKSFVFRLIFFLAIVMGCVCAACNYLITPTSNWSKMVIAVLAYGIWMLYILMKDDAGYRIRILTGAAGAVILVVLLDVLLGFRGWSVNYVLPADIIAVDIALALLMIINRRNWQSYLILQMGMIFISLIPFLLGKWGIVTDMIVSNVAMLLTVLSFVGAMILGGRTAYNEMRRRFHI